MHELIINIGEWINIYMPWLITFTRDSTLQM